MAKQNKSPFDSLEKLAKEQEQKTTKNLKNLKTDELTTARASKNLINDIKRLILDYGNYSTITEFINSAISEKLEEEKEKNK